MNLCRTDSVASIPTKTFFTYRHLSGGRWYVQTYGFKKNCNSSTHKVGMQNLLLTGAISIDTSFSTVDDKKGLYNPGKVTIPKI